MLCMIKLQLALASFLVFCTRGTYVANELILSKESPSGRSFVGTYEEDVTKASPDGRIANELDTYEHDDGVPSSDIHRER